MNEIKIHEVGLRDGLQIEKQTVPLEKKIAWVEGLLAAGIDMIQLGSFVNPEKVPQMADTDKLFAHFSQEGQEAGRGRPVRPGAQRKRAGARHGLRRRHVLHGGFGQRHPQPQEHRQVHRGGRRPDHRHGPGGHEGAEARAGLHPVGVRLRLRRPDPAGAGPVDRREVPRRGHPQHQPGRYGRPCLSRPRSNRCSARS